LVINADGTVDYTHNGSETVTDGFTYEILDNSGVTSNTATVTVTVTPLNDPPIIVSPATTSVFENVGFVLAISAFDGDGDPILYSIIGGDDASLFSLNSATGDLYFVTPPDFENPADDNGDNVFEVVVAADDGNGLVSTQPHQVILLNVNESVTAVADNFTVDENSVLSGSSVLANDLDIDGDSLSASLISGPSNGWIVWNIDGTFTYTPAANFAGADSFTYTATDGVFSDVETVIIDVLPIDDAPEVANPTIAPAPVIDNDSTPTADADDSDDLDETPNLILVELANNADDEEERDGVAIIRRDRTDRDVTATVVANSRNITVEDSAINQRSLFYASVGNLQRRVLVRAEAELAMLEPLQDVMEVGSQAFSLYATPFESALDDLRDDLNVDFHFEMVAMGATIATTGSISVGYVFWMIRGGYLLGSLLSQIPAWKIVDPLQILDVLGSDEDDDETLESIIDDAVN
jgi:hypothetical protein